MAIPHTIHPLPHATQTMSPPIEGGAGPIGPINASSFAAGKWERENGKAGKRRKLSDFDEACQPSQSPSIVSVERCVVRPSPESHLA
uniref:HDC02024 n=1 Tax=Drosophila melanogaster TaxID=7227 RepID=Q6IHP1_DROME|nr:TPA_inf: HDC02024 [Drosophila melanogaster]